MKFQNPIFNFERTDDKPKAIYSFNFSKVGGHLFQSWGHNKSIRACYQHNISRMRYPFSRFFYLSNNDASLLSTF